MNHRDIARRIALGLAFAGLVAAGPAQAALSGTVTVHLLAPGGTLADPMPIDLIDTLPAAPGTLILPGDGSNVGSFMLSAEQLALDGQTFLLTVAAGAALTGTGQLVTGYLGDAGGHARYDFSGLSIPGMRIVGLSLGSFDGYAASGFNGLASPTDLTQVIRLTSAHSFSVDLDTLSFVNRGNGESNAYADLRIGLLTTPVPEPAQAALWLGGLALLFALRRRA